MERCELFIVGAGAAGLSAARAAAEGGCKSILVADYNGAPGGILLKCAHRGFGAELTGAEYIARLMVDFPQEISFLWNTSVLSVDENRRAVLSSAENGLQYVHFKQMILAAGCREIPFGSLEIAGTRPLGIRTAGQIQQEMNLHGCIPQGPAVILGSGDVGLVAAWQLLEAGVEIAMLVEKKPRCGGLQRNWKRLEGHDLPVRCGSTVAAVHGDKHLTGATIRCLDTGAEEFVPCKTLVIAAGLLPEQELVRHLHHPDWLQLCGNCKSIHPMVEGVLQEGIRAGKTACEKLRGSI